MIQANPLREGWYAPKPVPVSTKAAGVYFDQLAKRKAKLKPTSSPPENNKNQFDSAILELARGLRNDPVRIYEFVKNHVEFEPYYGLRYGPRLTALLRAGGDFDQSALLIELLRASGHEAEFVHGVVQVSAEQLSSWFALPGTIGLEWAVYRAGIPIDLYNVAGRIQFLMAHVWVRATIDGETYDLDPSFKSHEVRDFASAEWLGLMGYDRNTFLQTVLDGASVTPDFVQNLNTEGLESLFVQYSTALANKFRSGEIDLSLSDLTGRDSIIPVDYREMAEDMPGNEYYEGTTWTGVPDVHIPKVRFSGIGIDREFALSEVHGNRLTLRFDGSGRAPRLRLNGNIVATGSSTNNGNFYDFTVSVDHPFAGDIGTFYDQEATDRIKSDSSATILHFVEGGLVNSALINEAEKRLAGYRNDGLNHGSEAVVGEMLNLMALSVNEQNQVFFRTAYASVGLAYEPIHSFGTFTQGSNTVLDWSGVRIARTDFDGAAVDQSKRSLAVWSFASALEHMIMDQTYEIEVGLSTVRVMAASNNIGEKAWFVNKGNFQELEPVLRDSHPQLVDRIQNLINEDGFAILPESSSLQVNDWQGSARYEQPGNSDSEYGGYLIGGGLLGGHATIQANPEPETVSENVERKNDHESPVVQDPTSQDPVNLFTGAFLLDNVDLTVGNAPFPRGMALERSHDTVFRQVRGPFGNSTRHTYDGKVVVRSDARITLGSRSLLDAVPSIVYSAVTSDVLDDLVGQWSWDDTDAVYKDDHLGMMIIFLAGDWLGKQTVGNTATVKLGKLSLDFVRQPDGTFVPPSPTTSSLEQGEDGAFVFRERLGRTFVFDGEDRLASVSDPSGNTGTLSYQGGKLHRVTDCYGRFLEFSYTGDLITEVTDSTGRSVEYGYDAGGNLTQYIDPEDASWLIRYDNLDRITEIETPEDFVSVINVYDEFDRVISQTIPKQAGNAIYDFFYSGTSTTEAGPESRETTHFFNREGRTTKVVDAMGFVTLSEFDDQGRLVLTVDKEGNGTLSEYDPFHRLEKVIYADGTSIRHEYDTQHRREKTIDQLGGEIIRTFDDKHRLLSERNQALRTTRYSYHSNGLVRQLTVPGNISTRFEYDAYGNVSSTILEDDPAIQTVYNELGDLLTVSDQGGSSTHYEYDNRRAVTKMTDAFGESVVSIYDGMGRLVSSTDRNGDVINRTYTETGLIDAISTSRGNHITFTYNIHDELIQRVDPTGTAVFEYDRLGRIRRSVDTQGFELRYDYDRNGNQVRFVYPNGKAVTKRYSVMNRLVSVRDWLGREFDYSYDEAGRLIEQSHYGGVETEYSFDPSGVLASIHRAPGNLPQYSYAINDRGLWGMIDASNHLNSPHPPIDETYQYSDGGNRLISDGRRSFNYDLQGQVASDGDFSFTYDEFHRLVGLTGIADGQAVENYIYDGSGERVGVATADGTRRFVHDVRGRVVAEADGTGVLETCYIHGVGLESVIFESGRSLGFLFDGSGNTVALIDEQGMIVSRFAYTPFGRLKGILGSIVPRFLFAGRVGVVTDSSGFFLMKARYYDPELGRFLSEDPLRQSGDDLSFYSYAGLNPLMLTDPSGMAGWLDLGAGLGAAWIGSQALVHTAGAAALIGISPVVVTSAGVVLLVGGAVHAGLALYDMAEDSEILKDVQRSLRSTFSAMDPLPSAYAGASSNIVQEKTFDNPRTGSVKAY